MRNSFCSMAVICSRMLKTIELSFYTIENQEEILFTILRGRKANLPTLHNCQFQGFLFLFIFLYPNTAEQSIITLVNGARLVRPDVYPKSSLYKEGSKLLRITLILLNTTIVQINSNPDWDSHKMDQVNMNNKMEKRGGGDCTCAVQAAYLSMPCHAKPMPAVQG